MKNKNTVRAIFSFIAISYFASCSKPMVPEYLGFDNLQINKISGNESLVKANIKFYNPNNYPLQLKHADVSFLLNDHPSAHCLIDSTINIPKRDSFYVPVAFNANLGNVLNNALQLLLKNKIKINAEGYVKLKKSGIPFSVPVHYETNENLDFLLNQLQ
jgi:LEA14-like dessication related protein